MKVFTLYFPFYVTLYFYCTTPSRFDLRAGTQEAEGAEGAAAQ